MLELMFQQTLVVCICIQGFVIGWQLLNIVLRIQERSKLNFLILVCAYLMFNALSFIHAKMPNLFDGALVNVFIGGSGMVLAAVLMLYVLREYSIPSPGVQNVKYVYPAFIVAVVIGFCVVSMVEGYVELLKTLFIPLPALLAVIYCISLECGLKRNGVILPDFNARMMLFCGYAGLILMAVVPASIYFNVGTNLNVLFNNLIFLFVLARYIRQLHIEAQLKHQKRQEADLTQYDLSNRELEVAMLLLEGLEYPDIADRLSVSETTVRSHISHAFKKTGTRSKVKFRQKFRKNTN